MQVIRAFAHASGLAVAGPTDMPTSAIVFIQVDLVEHVRTHAKDEWVARIRHGALA